MSLVLDCSVTLAAMYPDEGTPAIRAVFDQLAAEGAWVPSLWKLEVANLLQIGVRRGRHTADFRDAALVDLAALPIRVDSLTEQHAWRSTLRLAALHHLTLYDAAYLELALRRSLPLATLDRELRSAANAETVPLLGQ